MKKCLAEMIGTMVLVLIGCGAAVFAGAAQPFASVGTLGDFPVGKNQRQGCNDVYPVSDDRGDHRIFHIVVFGQGFGFNHHAHRCQRFCGGENGGRFRGRNRVHVHLRACRAWGYRQKRTEQVCGSDHRFRIGDDPYRLHPDYGNFRESCAKRRPRTL